jgi:hypothetical protein
MMQYTKQDYAQFWKHRYENSTDKASFTLRLEQLCIWVATYVRWVFLTMRLARHQKEVQLSVRHTIGEPVFSDNSERRWLSEDKSAEVKA